MNTTRMTTRLAPMLGALILMTSAALFAQKPDRTHPPMPGMMPSFRIPEIRMFSLSNGLRVYFMEKHEVPIIQMNVIVRAGSVDDGSTFGLASMTADMMDEGAGTFDAIQLADQIDFLGANISVAAGYHTTTVSLHTPLSKFDTALPLLSAILLEPTFPQAELDRLRKERLTSFLQWRDEPRAIASYAFDRVLYGESHPYGHPVVGEPSTVASLTRNDLVAFYGKNFNAANAAVVVVGDMTQKTLQPKLEAALGKWKKGEAKKAMSWKTTPITANAVYLIDKPGAAQSEIMIGRVAADRMTDDYYDMLVMNTILGGSFASRLNQNLREEHGYTYGARSGFSMRNLPGPFSASSSVQTDVTDKALTEFMNELRGILDPVPADELERAKNYVGLRYPENFQSVSRIAGQLDDMFIFGLPSSSYGDYMGRIQAVDGSGVQRVAARYVTPDAFAFVIVGDKEKIADGVTALGLGTLKMMSIEDVLGPAPTLE